MNAQSAKPSVNDIKHDIMKYYHQLQVTKENSKAVRAAAWALLANVLVSDYLNRWNEAGEGGKPGDAAGLLTDAKYAVDKALALDDKFALAHYADGLVHRAYGGDAERDQALQAFDKAINLDRTFARAYAQMGSEYINNGQFEKASKLIDKAIANGLNDNDPSAGMFYWNRGRALFFQKKYSKAIKPLLKAIELRSNLWHSQLYLASAYVLKEPPDLETAKELVRASGFTLRQVKLYEEANPSTHLKEGRLIFHAALERAEMPPE